MKKKFRWFTVLISIGFFTIVFARYAVRRWKGPFWDENDHERRVG